MPLVVSEICAWRQHGGPGHDVDEPAPQQRLAASEPHLGDPELPDADAEQPDQLVIGELVLARQPVKAFRRHAIRAPQVAPVGQRHSQIGGNTAVGVGEHQATSSSTSVVTPAYFAILLPAGNYPGIAPQTA